MIKLARRLIVLLLVFGLVLPAQAASARTRVPPLSPSLSAFQEQALIPGLAVAFFYGSGHKFTQLDLVLMGAMVAMALVPRFEQESPSKRLSEVLLEAKLPLENMKRIIYTSTGGDTAFVDLLLKELPAVSEVKLVSLDWTVDPVSFTGAIRRAYEIMRKHREEGRIVKIDLEAADFYQFKASPIDDQTLLLDKKFGQFSNKQGDPEYHQAILRNTRPGDVILSVPMAALLPFRNLFSNRVFVPEYPDYTSMWLFLRQGPNDLPVIGPPMGPLGRAA